MNLITIKKSLQPMIISSFWTMLRECEGQAENNADWVLKHQVEGYYRQWNAVTGDEKAPRWVVTAAAIVPELPQAPVLPPSFPLIRARVRAVVVEQLGLTDRELRDEVTMTELGADSLDEIEIAMALEDEFRLEISDEEAEAMRTVNDVVSWVAGKMS